MKSLKSHLALARKELASAGGKARAKALSREDRVKIARLGGQAGGRGRRKAEQIPDELREKIWALLASEAATTLWWATAEARQPRTRSMAKRSLRTVARYGTLHAYKTAHELVKCL